MANKQPAKIETAIKTVTSTVNREINETLMQMVSKNSTIISGTQTINISDLQCGGDLNISGISQKQIVTVNLKNLENIETYETLFSAAQQGLNAAVSSDNDIKKGALSLASDMGVSTTSDATGNIINEVKRGYTFQRFKEDLQQIDQAQYVNISRIVAGGTCNIRNISQYIVLEYVANNITDIIMEYVSEKVSNNEAINRGDSKTKYEQKGFFGEILEGITNMIKGITGGIFTVIALFIAIIIAVFYLGYKGISAILDVFSEPDSGTPGSNTEPKQVE